MAVTTVVCEQYPSTAAALLDPLHRAWGGGEANEALPLVGAARRFPACYQRVVSTRHARCGYAGALREKSRAVAIMRSRPASPLPRHVRLVKRPSRIDGPPSLPSLPSRRCGARVRYPAVRRGAVEPAPGTAPRGLRCARQSARPAALRDSGTVGRAAGNAGGTGPGCWPASMNCAGLVWSGSTTAPAVCGSPSRCAAHRSKRLRALAGGSQAGWSLTTPRPCLPSRAPSQPTSDER